MYASDEEYWGLDLARGTSWEDKNRIPWERPRYCRKHGGILVLRYMDETG